MRFIFHLAVTCTIIATFAGCESNSPKPKQLAKLVLPVGPLAQEIEGEDLDGKFFKLSEYKGKVVLLDFWGMWCGPCVAFLPHGKKVVEEFKGRPFVALGVN